jgi:hypothetical protein
MRYTATITAFDYMDQVGISAVVYEFPEKPGDGAERVYHRTLSVRGEGESDPEQWLKDAVISLLEDM